MPEWPDLEVRQVVIDQHRLLYHVVGDTVEILGLHPSAIPLPDGEGEEPE